MSRIVSGKVRLDVQPTSTSQRRRRGRGRVRAAGGRGARSIALQVVLDPAPGPVAATRAGCSRSSGTCSRNAIKFTPRGGAVQVALERVDSHVEITVARHRHGHRAGVPAARVRALPPGRRLDDARARRARPRAVDRAAAWSSCTAARVRGDERRARAAARPSPCACRIGRALGRRRGARQRAPARTASVRRRRCRLGGLSVLVVDDEADARELLSGMLGDCGAEVHAAGLGRRGARRCVAARRPDVLVSDIGMPERGRLRLDRAAARARCRTRRRDTRDRADGVRARRGSRAHACRRLPAHVAKPVEPQELLAAVARLAGRDPAR